MKPYFGMRGKALNYAVLMIAGCDFLLFGYGKQYRVFCRFDARPRARPVC